MFFPPKQLHLELTHACNAGCPLCPRNVYEHGKNPFLMSQHISLSDMKNWLNDDILSNLKHIFACGNYGDPIVAPDCLKIFSWLRSKSSSLELEVHTNGSYRDEIWFSELAGIIGHSGKVIFAIDGLADTNHLYRKKTDFDKIISNARAFIQNGGKADWTYIIFNHNRHQVGEAERFAKEIGFDTFTTKLNSRQSKPRRIRDTEKIVEGTGLFNEKPFYVFKEYKNETTYKDIICPSIRDTSVFITPNGFLFPCCFLGKAPWVWRDTEHEKEFRDWWQQIPERNKSLQHTTMREIIQSSWWQEIYTRLKGHKELFSACSVFCGADRISEPRTKNEKKLSCNSNETSYIQ